MSLALLALKDGEADAMLSCGNTGCLMAGGAIRLRTLEGVERPALCTIWPGRERYFTLLDAGANPHAKPFHIVQSAVLGSNYARLALGLVRPKVGLLTIGTEEGKGNDVIHETHSMLKDIDGSILNYAGLIEGFQIFDNAVDVVVCDGFVGNIVLKACESLSKLIGSFLDEELKRNALRKTGALLSKGAFRSLKQRINPEQFGGAPLLGLTKNVIKAHGSSNRNHISGAIKIALDLIQHDMLSQVTVDIKETNEILRPRASSLERNNSFWFMSDSASSILRGIGSYVPSRRVDNHELSEKVDTSDEWITSRTGIKERRFAGEKENTSDLALRASQRAIDMAGVSLDDIDLVLVATITPDMAFPSTACLLQHKLGIPKVACFDLEAACSGFLYALDVADGMLSSGRYKCALVVGAEKLSSIMDWEDRTTCVLFGDGAGAAVLTKTGEGSELLGFQCGADGSNPSFCINRPVVRRYRPQSTRYVTGGIF